MSKSKPPFGEKPVRRSNRWNDLHSAEAWRNADASIIPEYVPTPPFTRAWKRMVEISDTYRRN